LSSHISLNISRIDKKSYLKILFFREKKKDDLFKIRKKWIPVRQHISVLETVQKVSFSEVFRIISIGRMWIRKKHRLK